MIPLFRPYVAPDAGKAVAAVLASAWVGQGDLVRDFETRLGLIVGNPQFVFLNSCSSALALAFHLAGVRSGAEVISTPLTCVATNLAALNCGARVVWADVLPDGTISVESVAERITSRTRAICAVDFGGLPCQLAELRALAARHGLALIEDAAHALGSRYRGAPIGSHADYVCFSFQAVKTLTTGDGGGLAVLETAAYERARRLRWFGLDRDVPDRLNQRLPEAGFRYISNDIAAAIGLANLHHLDALLEVRRKIAAIYWRALDGVPGIALCHPIQDERSSAFWLFPILVDDKLAFQKCLHRHGIETGSVHVRNDVYEVFAQSPPGELPTLDYWDMHMTCLPIGPWLTEDDAARIADVVRASLG